MSEGLEGTPPLRPRLACAISSAGPFFPWNIRGVGAIVCLIRKLDGNEINFAAFTFGFCASILLVFLATCAAVALTDSVDLTPG